MVATVIHILLQLIVYIPIVLFTVAPTMPMIVVCMYLYIIIIIILVSSRFTGPVLYF